jgi:hypothetical protein
MLMWHLERQKVLRFASGCSNDAIQSYVSQKSMTVLAF